MGMTPGNRIGLIRESATLLDKRDRDDIDLVLGQYGLPTYDFDEFETKAAYIKAMIKGAADDVLTELHAYLTSEVDGGSSGNGPWTGDRLRLFCSHLATHRSLVSNVGDALARFGVEAFIAHDSIEPSREWQEVIEAALADCDAMVVFLHEGFRESNWCDQEVGWALGRNRPILPLNYGIHPYGFIGKYQDQPCSQAQPGQVPRFIMDWLSKTPSLRGRLGAGLVDAFVHSRSWDFTRSVIPLLERIESVPDDDLDRMEEAARENVDVSQCAVPGNLTGPEWVDQFVAKRRGTASAPTWPDDDPPF